MNHPSFIKPLLGLGLLLLTNATHAADLYVQTSRTNPEAGAGTSSNPYTSLTWAHKKAKAGDRILLKAGVHYPLTTESITWGVGTAAAPLVIQSEPGQWAVLDFSQTSSNNGLYVSSPYVTIQSLEVRKTKSFGILVEGSHTKILWCTVRETGSSGIHLGSFTVGAPISSNCTVKNNTITTVMLNNRASDGKAIGGDYIWNGGIDMMRLTNSEISYNKVSFVYGEGILTQLGSNLDIHHNEVNDAYSQNYYIDNTSYSNIQNNRSYSIWSSNFYRNGLPANGIALTDENKSVAPNSRHLYVYSNNVSDCGIGLWYWKGFRPDSDNPGLKNCDVYQNTFSYAVTALVQIPWAPGHSNTRVRNNTYVANNSGVVSIPSNISQN